MQEYVTVVLIKDNVIQESTLFVGPTSEVTQKAEACFKEYAESYLKNLDNFDAHLDNGYFEFESGSVCLTWPEVNTVN